MTLLVAWLLFPLVLGGISLGLGLLVDRCAGGTVPGALLLPLGFAALIVVSTLATTTSATAPLALPSALTLAILGGALELVFPSRARRLDRFAFAAAVAVFLVYGAPILLSGDATFAGYVKLDDTASWLGLTDRVLDHGRSLAGLPVSSYQATLAAYLEHGYPLGSVVPLGIGSRLVGTDTAWVFQPYLAFQGALLALALDSLLRDLVGSPRRRALAAFVAAQPALLYGYALWGSVKEVVTVPLLALVAALAPRLFRPGGGLRGLLPLGIAAAAVIGVLNLGGGIWVACAVLPCLALSLRLPRRIFAVRVGVLAGLAAALAIPTIVTARGFIGAALNELTGGGAPPNLIHPLSVLQVVGIWPSGDFRFRPGHIAVAYVLIAVALAVGAWGVLEALRRRKAEPALYVGVSLVGCAVLAGLGSDWVDAKVLATASPAVLVAGLAGASLAFDRGFRAVAAGVAVLVAGGVIWSNVLAWHDVWLAPRDQLAELETIGKRFAGQGPALINEPQVYGSTHFLRRLDPEAPGELRWRVLPLRDGSVVPPGRYADIDGFRLPSVLLYKTLVLPRSPVESRPPSVYEPAWSGRFYDVWQRPDAYPEVLVHLSLGRTRNVVGVASCADVMRVARLAADAHGRVVFVPRRPPATVDLAGRPRGLRFPVTVPGGAYEAWLAGSFAGRMEVLVDGRPVGASRHRIEHPGQLVPFGRVRLTAGRHEVTLHYSGADLHPGSAARFGILDRFVLARTTEDVPIRTIVPSRARELCGRSLDWIEAQAPA